ncbi:MAG: hypothetical protein U1A78_18335 [Polyangia bacterium]
MTCRIYKAATETAKHARAKLETLKTAIQGLQAAGLMFTNADVHKFKVGLYDTGPSRGLVYFKGANPLPVVVLQLGNRVSEHVKAGSLRAASATAGGETATPPRVVADRVYDYYKAAKFISPKDKCQLAQAYHELGHIMHQLNSPSEYILNADCASGNMATAAHTNRSNQLAQVVAEGKAHVSQYAGTTGDLKSLNEYVAEVFAGIMMGVDWNLVDGTGNVMAEYTALGGPAVPHVPGTISRLATFTTQDCHCPGAGNGTWGHGAKVTW